MLIVGWGVAAGYVDVITMTNVQLYTYFCGFCHLFSITTCGEFELQNSTDVITTTWDVLNKLNGMSLLSSGSEIL